MPSPLPCKCGPEAHATVRGPADKRAVILLRDGLEGLGRTDPPPARAHPAGCARASSLSTSLPLCSGNIQGANEPSVAVTHLGGWRCRRKGPPLPPASGICLAHFPCRF